MATAVDLEPAESEPESDAPTGKLASQVAHRIEAEVMRRGWPVGQSLGSELDLRERFGVSRSVLREAVRLVEHHQVARMRRGPNGGLFVCAPDAGPATRAMVIYLEYVGTSVADLLHARLLLEPIAAGLAAELITEDGIATLRATLEAEVTRQDEAGVWSQDPLHPALGKLSGNPVLHLFIDVLTRLTARYAHTSRRISKAEILAAKETSHRAHRAIVDAVTAGDGARAQTSLAEHLESTGKWIEAHRVRRASRVTGRVIEPELAEAPRAKLAEVVAARIHDEITARGWQVGSVLGSEGDLLARYGISRAVLREAVRLLEYHSVARMRRGPGGGLVVAEPEAQASIDTMALFLEHQHVTAEDLRIVRDAIELGTVARVITRHTEGDAEVAERLDTAVRWATEGPAEDPRKADLFHTELAQLAGNPVLSLFLRIITELFRRHAAGQDRQLPGNEAAAEVQHVHQRILTAILDGDAGVARHRMRRHLDALTPWWH
ncbi:FadR/GntR family transcriptional regulator [Pseudonocardia kunmingensis]|uniref:DNA-binding FadR family transcriptional regulator n=1 Tax=Pseudonocardia kunmingensis TaxID=630975 RepID=A0A543DPZ1_9PSEU|nr:FCD domain-containing protein [Pseudonocardia kunmingensis]TQM11373.1 DNA-binding FadR family transcriptional regulator [Pseudonocardia kunmingensis]